MLQLLLRTYLLNRSIGHCIVGRNFGSFVTHGIYRHRLLCLKNLLTIGFRNQTLYLLLRWKPCCAFIQDSLDVTLGIHLVSGWYSKLRGAFTVIASWYIFYYRSVWLSKYCSELVVFEVLDLKTMKLWHTIRSPRHGTRP